MFPVYVKKKNSRLSKAMVRNSTIILVDEKERGHSSHLGSRGSLKKTKSRLRDVMCERVSVTNT